jgi:hypothetical protein
MRWFTIQRRLFAALSITVLACGMALLSRSTASAAAMGATPFDVQGTARLQFSPASGAAPLVATLLPTVPISGAVDDAGGLTIGPANLSTTPDPIDRVTNTLLAAPLDVVQFTAPNGFTGSINPAAITGTGAFFTFSGNGDECTTAPADLTLYAVSYDPTSGAASFATDPSFVFPAFPQTRPDCQRPADIFNDLLQLPTAPGLAALTVDATLSIPSDPTTTPPGTTPPTAGGGSSSGSVVGSTPAAVPPKIVLRASSFRPKSPKTAAPKSTAATKSTAETKATTTTGYVWKGGSDVAAGQFDDQVTPPGAVAARPPILPQESTAKVATDSGNRYGLGILVLVLGAGAAAVLLLRSEARRLLRRRERAAF